MSSHARDAYETMNEAKQRLYVARQLRIDPETLDEHPYELVENGPDGITTSWDLYWEDTAPEGISTEGAEGSSWTSISPDYSDDSDQAPDEA